MGTMGYWNWFTREKGTVRAREPGEGREEGGGGGGGGASHNYFDRTKFKIQRNMKELVQTLTKIVKNHSEKV